MSGKNTSVFGIKHALRPKNASMPCAMPVSAAPTYPRCSPITREQRTLLAKNTRRLPKVPLPVRPPARFWAACLDGSSESERW
jgi:hypothetical protein